MQIANVVVAIGGDAGNQVPKFNVTAAEIAVLNAIHGDGAVTDILPTGKITRSHRDERARLMAIYGRMQDGKDISPVSQLFPGAAARVFEDLHELDLPEEMFKAKERVTSDAPAPTAPVRATSAAERKAARAAAAKAENDAATKQSVETKQPVETNAAAATEVVEDDGAEADGIEEMDDKSVLN
jgi:hypothetical protein